MTLPRRALIAGLGAAALVRPAWATVKPWTRGQVGLHDHHMHNAILHRGGGYVIAENGDLHFLDPVNFTPPPNDPNYTNQWHLPQCSVPQAWALSQGSTSTIIAFIGSGVSLTTDNPVSQLTGTNEPAGTTNTNDVYNGGTTGHDTITADLAMGATNDGAGSAGVCPNATLLPVVVLASNQSISNLYVGYALDFVAAKGAHIVSCSFNLSNAGNPYLASHAAGVWSAGGLIVGGTGDSPGTCAAGQDMAKEQNVLGVGSVDNTDTAASFNCTYNLSLVAPGGGGSSGGICATGTNGVTGCGVNGTSFATPIVAGVCGLMRTANPRITLRNDEMYNLLLRYGCDHIQGIAGWPTLDPTYGYGRVNAYKACLAAAAYVRPFPVRSSPLGGL